MIFEPPRTVDYRASVQDIARYMKDLMTSPALRREMGAAGRIHVVERFDYRVVARRFVEIIHNKLGIY